AYNGEAAQSKFLDIEAAMDEENWDEEEQENEEDGFIDHNTDPKNYTLWWRDYGAPAKDNERTAIMLEALADCYCHEVRPDHPPEQPLDRNITLHLDELVCSLSTEDQGLWHVLCWVSSILSNLTYTKSL
ncbi:hypothetical protein H0H81_005389, partial [Sphagnurus paluster]